MTAAMEMQHPDITTEMRDRIDAIIQANRLTRPEMIYPGQRLVIPSSYRSKACPRSGMSTWGTPCS